MIDSKERLNLVLLIDDNSIDNFINQKMIEQNGFAKSIKIYTNAKEALKYLSETDEQKTDINSVPSIIFLDLNMPLINGFKFVELYEKLSAFIKSKCKIVILTSSLNPNDKFSSTSNKNILAFLHKPLLNNNFQELRSLLKENFKVFDSKK